MSFILLWGCGSFGYCVMSVSSFNLIHWHPQLLSCVHASTSPLKDLLLVTVCVNVVFQLVHVVERRVWWTCCSIMWTLVVHLFIQEKGKKRVTLFNRENSGKKVPHKIPTFKLWLSGVSFFFFFTKTHSPVIVFVKTGFLAILFFVKRRQKVKISTCMASY